MSRRPRPWFWKARRAWYVTLEGARHRLGEDKSDAFQRFYQLMQQPKRCHVASQSLVAVIDEFLEWVQKHRAPSNYEGYRYRLQRFVERWPNLRPDELRPWHVQQWADAFDISQTTRRNYLRAVKRCLRWAKQQGYIDANPIAELPLPAAENREVMIRPAEFERLLELVPPGDFRDLLLVTWDTGCRPQEILKVTANHVDLTHGRWVFKKSEAKMKRKVRVVYLSERALVITRRLMAAHPAGTLFRNSRGRPWTTCAVNCRFQQLRIRMGMESFRREKVRLDETELAERVTRLSKTRREGNQRIEKSERELAAEARRKLRYRRAAALAPRYSLYALRHSWATNALERGVDALTVAVLMGHSDPSTLARVYQHLSQNPEHLREQARRAITPSPGMPG
ncbi:MAG: tyrosine-type recombinase/integrase [Planctomycetia bacterium]|nr:tyrosine-type recombinase/integrase [Planctomycetia bacterium]